MSYGEYVRLRTGFWSDPDVRRSVTIEQKALLLYYISSPHCNMVGIYWCPYTYVSMETGIPLEDVREWTQGPLARWVTYDEHTEEVFVHKAARHQIGEELKDGDKRRSVVRRLLASVHSPYLLAMWKETYSGWADDIPGDDPPEDYNPRIEQSPDGASNGALEAPSTALQGSSGHGMAGSTDSSLRSESGAAVVENSADVEKPPPDDRPVNDVVAPIIRRRWWQAKDPPPQAPNGWNLGRDISVCKRLIGSEGWTLAELEAALEEYEGPPATLAVAMKEGNRHVLYQLREKISQRERSTEVSRVGDVLKEMAS